MAQIINARAASPYGPRRLGAILDVPASRVAKVLRRAGLSRLPRAPRPAIVRYERDHPGGLLHVNLKRLGRFHQVGKRILHDGVQRSPRAGWHHLHLVLRISRTQTIPRGMPWPMRRTIASKPFGA